MGWREALGSLYDKIKPTTVSVEDQKTADALAMSDKRDLERKKREKADADAKAARLRWSPIERNAQMKKALED